MPDMTSVMFCIAIVASEAAFPLIPITRTVGEPKVGPRGDLSLLV